MIRSVICARPKTHMAWWILFSAVVPPLLWSGLTGMETLPVWLWRFMLMIHLSH